MLVLGHARQGNVWCSALDNAGAAFVLNRLSCGCPLTLELLRRLADCLAANHSGLLAGHAHREKNFHTDELSHVMTPSLWRQVMSGVASGRKGKDEVHFVVCNLHTRECFAATVAFTRPLDQRV